MKSSFKLAKPLITADLKTIGQVRKANGTILANVMLYA